VIRGKLKVGGCNNPAFEAEAPPRRLLVEVPKGGATKLEARLREEEPNGSSIIVLPGCRTPGVGVRGAATSIIVTRRSSRRAQRRPPPP